MIKCVIIFMLTLFLYATETKLISVHIISRHGIRAPVQTFPLDPYINQTSTLWPNGLSQLTNKGIEMTINFGQYLRQRYLDFYPRDPRNALFQTSNVDRCRDSLAFVSNQLWPPTGRLNYTPPRIYSAPTQIDSVLYTGFSCPVAVQQLNAYLVSPSVSAYFAQNQWFYDIVANYTGLPASLESALFAFDNFKAYKAEGIPVPEWGLKYWDLLSEAFMAYFNFFYDPPSGLRLGAGGFLSELSLRMNQALSSSISVDPFYKNFFLYNSHDLNIHGITRALGAQQSTYPPYGATIIFELHNIQRDSNIVRTYYLNKTESLPIGGVQLKLPECGSLDCPFKTFIASISKLIPDIQSECGYPLSFNPIAIVQQNLTDVLH